MNEIQITASLTVNKPTIMSSAVARSISNLLRNMNGNFIIGPTQMSVPTSATLIPIGGITSPHYAFFENMDPTNYITIRNGAGGADVPQLFAGDVAFIPLLITGTFYAIANTAACIMEYMILSN